MNLFRQLKTYFVPLEQPSPAASNEANGSLAAGSKIRSSSFELIVDDILDEKSSDGFIILGESQR